MWVCVCGEVFCSYCCALCLPFFMALCVRSSAFLPLMLLLLLLLLLFVRWLVHFACWQINYKLFRWLAVRFILQQLSIFSWVFFALCLWSWYRCVANVDGAAASGRCDGGASFSLLPSSANSLLIRNISNAVAECIVVLLHELVTLVTHILMYFQMRVWDISGKMSVCVSPFSTLRQALSRWPSFILCTHTYVCVSMYMWVVVCNTSKLSCQAVHFL